MRPCRHLHVFFSGVGMSPDPPRRALLLINGGSHPPPQRKKILYETDKKGS